MLVQMGEAFGHVEVLLPHGVIVDVGTWLECQGTWARDTKRREGTRKAVGTPVVPRGGRAAWGQPGCV